MRSCVEAALKKIPAAHKSQSMQVELGFHYFHKMIEDKLS